MGYCARSGHTHRTPCKAQPCKACMTARGRPRTGHTGPNAHYINKECGNRAKRRETGAGAPTARTRTRSHTRPLTLNPYHPLAGCPRGGVGSPGPLRWPCEPPGVRVLAPGHAGAGRSAPRAPNATWGQPKRHHALRKRDPRAARPRAAPPPASAGPNTAAHTPVFPLRGRPGRSSPRPRWWGARLQACCWK